MPKAKRPAFMFYPKDWQSDPALRACSIAARGLWIELLCIMHDCEPYGYLQVNHTPLSHDAISRLIGVEKETVSRVMAQLTHNGVLSIDDRGCIYSRRMVADEALRQRRADAGKLGGNPALLKLHVNHPLKPLVEPKVKQKPTPAFAVAFAVTDSISPMVLDVPSAAAPKTTPEEARAALEKIKTRLNKSSPVKTETANLEPEPDEPTAEQIADRERERSRQIKATAQAIKASEAAHQPDPFPKDGAAARMAMLTEGPKSRPQPAAVITSKSNGAQPWHKSDDGIMRKARELNLTPTKGETYAQIKRRIFDTIAARKA